jgi:hypothetical protein
MTRHPLPAGDVSDRAASVREGFRPRRGESRCAGCSLRRGKKIDQRQAPLERPCVTMMMAIIAGEPLL